MRYSTIYIVKMNYLRWPSEHIVMVKLICNSSTLLIECNIRFTSALLILRYIEEIYSFAILKKFIVSIKNLSLCYTPSVPY